MPLRPEHLHSAAFSRPPLGARSYDQSPVDALLARVAAALAGSHDPGLVEELRTASLAQPGWGRRGYNPDEVDALLDLCVAELPRPDLPGAPTPTRTGADHPDDPADPTGPADPADPQPAASVSADSARGHDGIRVRSAAALHGTDPLTTAELGAFRPPVTRRPGRGYQVGAFDRVLVGVANELRHRGR
jgi:DivIVA domain-containing protein